MRPEAELTYKELEPMLFWRHRSLAVRGVTPQLLVECLSVEGLQGVQVPEQYERAVIGFHKRTRLAREAVARRFLQERPL